MKTGYQFMRKAITIVFVFLSTAIIVAQSLSGPDKVKSGGTFDYSFEDGGNYYQIKRGVFTARYLDNNLIAGEGTSLGDYDYNTAKVEFRNLYAEDKEAEISAVFTETNNHTFTLTKRITILGENPFYLPNSTPKYGEKGYIPILSRVKLPSSYTISWSLSGGSTIVSSNNSLIEVDWNTIGTHVLTALVHYKGKVYTVSKNITINPIYRKNPLIVGETAVELNTDIKYNLKAEPLSKAQVTWSITGGTIVHKNNTGVVVNWTNKKEGVLSASVNFLDDGLAPYNTELKVAVVPKVVSPYKGTTAANENYIRTVKYLTPIVADINTAVKKTETITYIDALGRPKQQVNVKAGGNKENIITHIEYDVLGRQTKEFLPYAFTTSNNLYRTQPASESYAFYNTPKYENTLNPYAEMQFEGNSLNRIIKKAVPGKDWGAHIMDEHTVRTKYDVVKDEDEVMILRKEYDSQTPFHMTVHNTHKGYGKGLYKKVTKNENWKLTDGKDNTIEEYTDYQHRLLLKRTYNKGIPHDTYYVYDDFENLSFVIPPKVTFPISDEAMNNLCYQYKYDSRNRLIEKKLPGKGWEFIVYDNLDRPVLTQDSNLKQKQQWLYTKYDVLGRVAYTGVYVDVIGRSRASAQADIDSYVSGNATRHYEVLGDFSTYAGVPIYYGNRAYPNSRSLDIFTINYYDRYLDLPIGLENRITTSYGVMSTLNTKGLSTVRKTRVLDTNQWITNVTYYDEKGRVIYVYSKNDYLRTVDIVEHKLDDFTGKVIETKTTHNKEGEDAIESIERFEYDHMDRLLSHTQKLNDQLEERLFRNHYDELGQLSYKLVGNGTKSGYKDVSSGIDIEEDLIRKTGAKGWTAGLATLGSIEKDGYVSFSVVELGKYYMVGLSKENTDVHYKSIDYAIYIHASKVYIYEKGSFRGVETSYKVGDVFQAERIGSEVFYKKNGTIFYKSTTPSSGSLLGDVSMFHEGGEIRDLKLVDNTKGLQKVDYSYNIRGWLKKINEDGFKDNDLFNFTINYNSIEGNAGASGKAIPLYNGNISQTIWSSKSTDQTKRAYGYKYDALNRLSVAYSRKGHDLNTADKYSMWLDYDKNGNINRLFRNGVHNTVYGRVDDLSYSYIGNQLTKVTENGSSLIKSEGFKDVNNAIDYTYDVNGNMTKDLNKGITNISYNHLNLPTRVTIGGKNIDYTYDAGGVKLSKTVSGVATQYAGNYVYENGVLQFFNHPEGYVLPKNASDISQGFKYVYQYKDHLGNVRLSYTDNNNDGVITPSTEIIEESNYYPFGLKHKGYNNVVNSIGNSTAQKFGYNGKELNEELGLEWHDFGARNYDASLGRFMNIDPLAEINQRSWTPYHYVKNNPIKFTDPSGMIWKDPSKAEDLKKKINNRKNSLAKTKTRLQKKLGKEGISDKKKARLEKRIAGIDSRTESLDGSIADIDALGADQENTFDLVSSNSDTNHVKKGSDGVINIQGSTDALHIHEIKHTALSLSSEKGLDFNSNNYLKPALSSNGLKDEIAAYKAQHAYSPSSLPGSVSSGSGINIKYIANLKKSDGTPVYPAISRSWKARQRGIKSYKKYLKQKVKK